jgi:hypothetical protein
VQKDAPVLMLHLKCSFDYSGSELETKDIDFIDDWTPFGDGKYEAV